MLVRDDLKQYTADACMALLVLALTSRLEREWSRLGLVALSTAVWGGMLFSDASAFAGVAAFGAVCVVQFAQRAWRLLAEVAAVGAGTAVLMLGVYEGFDARAASPTTGRPAFLPAEPTPLSCKDTRHTSPVSRKSSWPAPGIPPGSRLLCPRPWPGNAPAAGSGSSARTCQRPSGRRG